MRYTRRVWFVLAGLFTAAALTAAPASAQQRPNIIMIMGDDVGWFNIGAYHQGMMAGRTPNLDRLASEGMRFTDYYAEPSCTAGRANFITGELPIRTGLTTVGQAGATVGMPATAPTIATALKAMGYATGQFGKNHLGDLNQFRGASAGRRCTETMREYLRSGTLRWISPDSVSTPISAFTPLLQYYSFATLATLGYGDITPLSAVARALTAIPTGPQRSESAVWSCGILWLGDSDA